jgi:hypothetical protein
MRRYWALFVLLGCASRPSATREGPPRGRQPLGAVEDVPLQFELKTAAGGGLVAVSSAAGDRVTWARRIDGATGEMGPLLRFVDERFVGLFDTKDAVSVATSDGQRLCVGRYPAEASEPEKR